MNPWPALSPDLNPIEFILGDMKQAVAQTRPNSIPSLRLAIRTAWWRVVTPEYCATLYGAESTTLKLWSRIKGLVDVTLTFPQLFKLASLSHQLSIFANWKFLIFLYCPRFLVSTVYFVLQISYCISSQHGVNLNPSALFSRGKFKKSLLVF